MHFIFSVFNDLANTRTHARTHARTHVRTQKVKVFKRLILQSA